MKKRLERRTQGRKEFLPDAEFPDPKIAAAISGDIDQMKKRLAKSDQISDSQTRFAAAANAVMEELAEIQSFAQQVVLINA